MALVNDIAYIEKALPGVLDKVLACRSFTDALIGGSEVKLEFLDARTVKIFKLATTSMTNYQRGGHGVANTRGAVDSSFETFTLSQERYSEIPLDKLDTLDDAGTILGKLANEFIRVVITKELDTYRFSKLASYTSATIGNRVVETIANNTIISKFNAALKWLAEQKVPNEDQIIYVNPSVMQLIRNTSELAKRLLPADMDKDIKFAISKYEGRLIVEVPSDTFYTDAQVGDGIYPAASSKVINFMIVWKKAPIIVKNFDFNKIYNSVDGNGSYLGFVGFLFTNLLYHDIFVPENKKLGIYCSISNESAAVYGAGLLVDAVASVEVNKTVIKDVITQPAGQFYDALYLSTAASAPAIGSISTSLTQIYKDVPFTPDNTHNYIVASKDGKVLCVSKDFEGNLPKGQ